MYPWVSDTRPLPDGYGHGYEFLPVGMIMGGDVLRPRILSRAGICFTRSVSNPLPSLTMSRTFISKSFLGPCAAKDMERWLPLQLPNKKVNNRAECRRVGSTCGFAASPEEGPGATVDTLQTGYPYIQALSQDK
jgi:hypothetical protein